MRAMPSMCPTKTVPWPNDDHQKYHKRSVLTSYLHLAIFDTFDRNPLLAFMTPSFKNLRSLKFKRVAAATSPIWQWRWEWTSSHRWYSLKCEKNQWMNSHSNAPYRAQTAYDSWNKTDKWDHKTETAKFPGEKTSAQSYGLWGKSKWPLECGKFCWQP